MRGIIVSRVLIGALFGGLAGVVMMSVLQGDDPASRKVTVLIGLLTMGVALLTFRQKIASDNRSEWWRRFDWAITEERRIKDELNDVDASDFMIWSEVQKSLLEDGRGRLWTESENSLIAPLTEKGILLQLRWIIAIGTPESEIRRTFGPYLSSERLDHYLEENRRSME